MALPHEHYKAQGEISPLTTYFLNIARIGLIVLLVLFCHRGMRAESQTIQSAQLTLQDNRISRTTIAAQSAPSWPEKTLHAVWPDKVLYLGPDLEVVHARSFETNELFTADAWGYAMYGKTETAIVAFGSDGKEEFRHKATAWPRAIGAKDWLLLYTGDQAGMAFLRRPGGEQVGPYQQLSALITASVCSDREKAVYFGLADGSLEKFLIGQGKTGWRKRPPSGAQPVIKGLAISPSGLSVLAVSGSSPEVLSLVDSDGKIRWSRETAGDLRTQVACALGARFACSHGAHRLFVHDAASGSLEHDLGSSIERTARIVWTSVAESPRTGRLLATVSQGPATTVLAISAAGRIIDAEVLDSPWAEAAYASDGSTLALKTRTGIRIARPLESGI